MQNSLEATAPDVAGSADLRLPERSQVRRRLVQSTLFPNKSQDNETKKEGENCHDDDAEEEEYCGSKGKKNKKRKPRSSKKVAVDGKKTLSKSVDDKDSPSTVRQKMQVEQQCVVSPEDNGKTRSPSEPAIDMKTPRQSKRRVNSTPKKRHLRTTPKKSGGLNEACSEQLSNSPIHVGILGNVTQLIPDLRLEAKLTAEENARMFGGRQIHPFFSSCKMTRKRQETIDVDDNWCYVERKDGITTFSSIHIYEKVQDDVGSPDWGNWVLSERSFIDTNRGLEILGLPVFESSVKSLYFDDFPNLYPSRKSLLLREAVQHEEVSLDQSPVQEEYRPAMPTILSAEEPVTSADEPVMNKLKLSKDREVNWEDHNTGKADFLSAHTGLRRNLDVFREDTFRERMIENHATANHPQNSLWTSKYLPEKALEVCGNGESVNFLSEWLRLWHERGFRSSKDHTVGENCTMQDEDYNCHQSDCDSENRDEENGLKNVLLVTGSVGSGKSAAIYACAKEQGFRVIEVNASDWRTRTILMQRFGGGVDSYWVQRALETPVASESKSVPKSSQVISSTTIVQVSDIEIVETIPLSDDEDSQNATGTPGKFVCDENRTSTDPRERKPLILFEDVDAIPFEDHGLIATIQKLAETARRPIILTSNSYDPVLPNNLYRHELCFTKPSLKELLCLVKMICAAEKVKIEPCLVERFVGCCQGDIRKTIMHLQFWCQGQRYRKDDKEQRNFGPLMFDLDAGHRILPNLLPWGYTSQLSEIVEEEITKSLLMMEESSMLTKVVKEVELSKSETKNRSKRNTSKTDSIELKKESILRRHCPVQDGNEFFTQLNTASPFSNSSGSPVAFTRRNVRRKLDSVFSSSSESESLDDRFPVTRDKLFKVSNSEMFPEVLSQSPSNCFATEVCFSQVPEQLLNYREEKLKDSPNPSCEQPLYSEGEKLLENCSQCSETVVVEQINGTYESVDISYVPESSFVPETEINEGSSLSCKTIACSNDLIQDMHPVETNNINQSISGLQESPEPKLVDDIYTDPTNEEEVENSLTEPVDATPKRFQLMDECSRVDFRTSVNSKAKSRSCILLDSVQETWRKFRGSHTGLRQYVNPEQKDASLVLKLAYGMSKLISEADILLGDCEPLIYDSLEPSMVPSERSQSLSWCDDQLSMTSTMAQHGLCYYSKEIAAVQTNHSSTNTMDLVREMLAASTNTMALGKLVSHDRVIKCSELGPLERVISTKSELDSRLCSLVQSIVPSRSYLSTKGDAFYEYLSSLGQISRSEASRLSDSTDRTKQKRVRAGRNYLSAGALLSPDDISLVGQYNCYGKGSSPSMDASLREQRGKANG